MILIPYRSPKPKTLSHIIPVTVYIGVVILIHTLLVMNTVVGVRSIESVYVYI